MKERVLVLGAGAILLFAVAFLFLGREGDGSSETLPEATDDAVALGGEEHREVYAALAAQVNGEVDEQELDPDEQPIQFPHDVHAGEFQIDCKYCHASADRGPRAGIPASATCMGCHNVIAGEERADQIDRLREFHEAEEPIPWARVYSVADHVQFPHMRHVEAGVECQDCHGDVETIDVIEEVEQDLTMGWCLNCHIEEGASRDCAVCHY